MFLYLICFCFNVFIFYVIDHFNCPEGLCFILQQTLLYFKQFDCELLLQTNVHLLWNKHSAKLSFKKIYTWSGYNDLLILSQCCLFWSSSNTSPSDASFSADSLQCSLFLHVWQLFQSMGASYPGPTDSQFLLIKLVIILFTASFNAWFSGTDPH